MKVHQVVFDGVHNADRWVLDALEALDRTGTLDQLEPHAIYHHLQHSATKLEPTLTPAHPSRQQNGHHLPGR